MEEYKRATRSRSVIDTYLYEDTYDGLYIRDNPGDTAAKSSIGVFWDSPDIWVRNIDDGITEHQDTIRGQDNWVYVRVHNSTSKVMGEITINLYRANYAGTEFLYPQDWRIEDRIGSAVVPAPSVPPGGDYVAKFRLLRGMIPPGTWHPCLLAEILPIHRTNLLLRTVQDDCRLAQKNITIVGHDLIGSSGLHFPFRIGTASSPSRLVKLKIRQLEGDALRSLALEMGNPPDNMNEIAQGGDIRRGRAILTFELSNPRNGGEIILPLLEGEWRDLTLKAYPSDSCRGGVKIEIIQTDNERRVVGGLYVIIS